MTAAVVNGDCAEVLRGLVGKVNLIVTSPPYDDTRKYGGHGFDFDVTADACATSLTPGGVIIWVVADRIKNKVRTGTAHQQALAFVEKGLNLHDVMIYHRIGPPIRGGKRYISAFEFMFVLSNGEPATFNPIKDKPNKKAGQVNPRTRMGRPVDGRLLKDEGTYVVAPMGIRTNVWEYDVGKGRVSPDYPNAKEHPAIFPLALAEDHIRTWTNPGDLVVDPMCGSGTVLVAATKLGRPAIGIDIHDEYCELARRRLANLANTEEALHA